jgi:hypothetical protein
VYELITPNAFISFTEKNENAAFDKRLGENDVTGTINLFRRVKVTQLRHRAALFAPGIYSNPRPIFERLPKWSNLGDQLSHA